MFHLEADNLGLSACSRTVQAMSKAVRAGLRLSGFQVGLGTNTRRRTKPNGESVPRRPRAYPCRRLKSVQATSREGPVSMAWSGCVQSLEGDAALCLQRSMTAARRPVATRLGDARCCAAGLLQRFAEQHGLRRRRRSWRQRGADGMLFPARYTTPPRQPERRAASPFRGRRNHP
jgi:hypothetical protein